MSVREIAVQDILNELEHEKKCFIAFCEELNPIMDSLVKQQLEEQELINNK